MQATPDRRFLDKVLRDPLASLQDRSSAVRFLRACLEFRDDAVDLLFRLTNRKASACFFADMLASHHFKLLIVLVG